MGATILSWIVFLMGMTWISTGFGLQLDDGCRATPPKKRRTKVNANEDIYTPELAMAA